MNTAVMSNEERVATLVGTPVEVHTRFQLGMWAPGFAIAEVLPDGYRLRRLSDGDVLREVFPSADVRLPSSMHASGPFPEPLGPRPPAPSRGAPGCPHDR
jgi:hypothetical protein